MPKPQPLTDSAGNEFTLSLKSVTIGRHGSANIVLPESLTLSEAVYWLNQKLTEEMQKVQISERIAGYPIDVANALQEAVADIFGFRELKSIPGFFGEKPPVFLSVPTDHKGGTTTVFIGRFSIPGCDGWIQTGREYNDALHIQGELRKKDLPVLNSLIARTKELLYQRSLYKGKAFRVWTERRDEDSLDKQTTMADPEFIDVSRRPANLILNATTTALIRAALWTPIRQSDKTRHNGVGLRRGILLYGDFGTGKSLTAMETAAICEQNGWTFIYVKDVRNLKEMYRFAARYAPAVLFAEDIDLVIGDSHDEAGINMLNNVLDGVDTKNAEVITVLTTNFINKLPTSLLRPGRFHTIVEYERPDKATAARLIAQYADGHLDIDDYDVDMVGTALADNIPATIAEVVNRAKLYAIDRTPEDFRGPLKLTTEDLLLSASSMKKHMALLNRPAAKDPNALEQFAVAFGGALVNAVAEALETDPEYLADTFDVELSDLRKRAADGVTKRLQEPVTNGR